MFKGSILARNRLQAGAVELESAELRFNTDAAGQPTTVTVKQVRLARVLRQLWPAGCLVCASFYTFPHADM